MYHNEIKKVTIPATVTFIGTGAFERCDNLKSVVFKDGIEDLSLYENSFWKTAIDSLYMGRNLNILEGHYINYWSSLKSLTIGPGASQSSKNFFLTRANILKILDTDIPYVFTAELSANTIYVGRRLISDGRNNHGAITGECSSITFGKKVTELDNYYFRNLLIKDFTIPTAIKELKDNTFRECSITNFIIEQSDTPLILESYNALYRTEIDSLYLGRELVYADNSFGVFSPRNWYNSKLNSILKYVYMDDNVVNINGAAFQYDNYITYVRFSPFVETIPGACFDHSGAIRDLVMPKSLKAVEYSAFSNCGIDIADFSNTKLETIGNRAFYCALGLTKIVLPTTITQIGNEALAWCSKLNEIIIYSKQVPTIYERTFYNTTLSNITLRVPEDMVEAYKADSQWKKIKNIVPIETSDIKNVVSSNNDNLKAYYIDGIHSDNRKGLLIVPTTKGYKKCLKR